MLFLFSLSLTRKTVKPKTDLLSAPRAEVYQRFLGNTFINSLHSTYYTHTYMLKHAGTTQSSDIWSGGYYTTYTSNYCFKILSEDYDKTVEAETLPQHSQCHLQFAPFIENSEYVSIIRTDLCRKYC